jgi:ABC-2 type transport system ATP-binding protein
MTRINSMTIGGPADAAIRIQGMTKIYKGNVAVDRLDLVVPTGSVFGLLGENGAGKTTTIRSLIGLVTPDFGSISVLGLNPTKQGIEVRRRICYVPEQPALYEWMSVGEIGWFAAGFHPVCPGGTYGFQTRFNQLAEGFGLPSNRKIRALSKGMKAKVSLSLALAGEPGLLILDEPTSGLDALVRRDFLQSMVELAGAGRTVLLSSHQIAEVERVASHVALMHKGKLALAEPLDDLRARTFLLELTFADRDHPLSPPPTSPLELVDADDEPRQARWLVHGPNRAACEALRSIPGLTGLEIKMPTLEDIYIAYMRGRKEADGPRPALAVHVA